MQPRETGLLEVLVKTESQDSTQTTTLVNQSPRVFPTFEKTTKFLGWAKNVELTMNSTKTSTEQDWHHNDHESNKMYVKEKAYRLGSKEKKM